MDEQKRAEIQKVTVQDAVRDILTKTDPSGANMNRAVFHCGAVVVMALAVDTAVFGSGSILLISGHAINAAVQHYPFLSMEQIGSSLTNGVEHFSAVYDSIAQGDYRAGLDAAKDRAVAWLHYAADRIVENYNALKATVTDIAGFFTNSGPIARLTAGVGFIMAAHGQFEFLKMIYQNITKTSPEHRIEKLEQALKDATSGSATTQDTVIMMMREDGTMTSVSDQEAKSILARLARQLHEAPNPINVDDLIQAETTDAPEAAAGAEGTTKERLRDTLAGKPADELDDEAYVNAALANSVPAPSDGQERIIFIADETSSEAIDALSQKVREGKDRETLERARSLASDKMHEVEMHMDARSASISRSSLWDLHPSGSKVNVLEVQNRIRMSAASISRHVQASDYSQIDRGCGVEDARITRSPPGPGLN